MFTKELNGLTLANKVADTLFRNINGNHFRSDESFLATLRALLYSRVPKEESVRLKYVSRNYTKTTIEAASGGDFIRSLLSDSGVRDGETGVLYVCSFNMAEDAATTAISVLDGHFGKVVKHYVHLEDIEKFLEQKKIRARIMLNEEAKNVLIFMERVDLKRWHLMQAMIPRYFPWYFNDNPINAEETALIKSLTGRYAPDYEEALEVFTNKFDFKTQAIRGMLGGFEVGFERTKLDQIRRQIRDTLASMESLDRQYADYYTRYQDLTTNEYGLMEKINMGKTEEESELMRFFINSKALHLQSAENGRLEFMVTSYLNHWDPELFEPLIRNKNGCFFKDHWANNGHKFVSEEFTAEMIERLMRAIFEHETVKLRVCAKYYLDFARGEYGGVKHYTYPADILRTNTPNQHIQEYACLGGNRSTVSRCVRDKEYVGAVVSCIASASNINFGEPHTVSLFMREISKKDVGRIIELPDGTCVTPVEAAKWLEENEK